jgi:HK97 family phage portal protein
VTILGAMLGRGPRAGLQNPAVPLTSTVLLDWLHGGRPQSGLHVTEDRVQGIPAVHRALDVIGGTCAALPLHAYVPDGGARQLLSAGPEADLLARPHPDMTDFELWELGYRSVGLWGNAAFLKLRDQMGVVRELWWIAPHRIRYGRLTDGPDAGRKIYTLDGDTENVLTDRQVLHIPGPGYDGVCGVSPLRVARETFGLALAADEFAGAFFGKGMLATGILQTDQRIDDTTAREIKTRWKAGGTGLESAHDIRVLGSGAKFQQLTIPAKDAQFLESRDFQVTEIARWFGIPPHMLMQTDKSTSWGSGIEEQTIGFVTYTLRQWLTRFERRITRMWDGSPAYARYSVEGLLRGNSAARAAWYRQMWELGAMSTNDIRAFEELPPVEGGDERWRPLNFAPLTQVDPAPAAGAQSDPVPTGA